MTTIRLGHGLSGLRSSLTNGPGRRVSLWTQGCSLRCTNQCLNPHLLSERGGHLVTVASVVERVIGIHERECRLEGITVLGGEPLDQPDGIAELFECVHERGLSTMLYTGHIYESIQSDARPIIQRLLASVDVMVDGPFLPNLYDEQIAWRGSRNQRLLCVSARYGVSDLEGRYRTQGKAFSIRVTSDGSVSVSGLQERAAAVRVASVLDVG